MKYLNKYMMSFLVAICALLTTSCEKDNYDEPNAAIVGQIVDHNGNPLQVAQGKTSMSIRIVEKSYAHGDESIVVTPQDLNVMQDGKYQNVHLFGGTYDVTPFQGPFFENDEHALTQEVVLKGGKTTTVNFTVTPYVTLEWVKEPYMDADGKLKASFKFKRNEKEGCTKPDLQDCCIWISRTQYCGTEGDGNYTPGVTKLTAADEGKEIELSSKIAIKYAMKYWVRIGVRCNDKYKKYIFTDIKTIDVQESQLKK